MNTKHKVFVIMPFDDDEKSLCEEFKERFKEKYDVYNAGDLENQQNILKDIVVGISQSDVIIADLTGLNANVFYELGLAHALSKKVIIITQDIAELPFDIKSYRVIQYSLKFNELPKLIEELSKLLDGAINGSIKFGNPVSDYAPNSISNITGVVTESTDLNNEDVNTTNNSDEDGEKGFLDCIDDINENSMKIQDEFVAMGNEMQDMNDAVSQATIDINRVNARSGNMDVSYARNICRKLSGPMDKYSEELKAHVNNISDYWNDIENCFLSLLDNQYIQDKSNIDSLKELIKELDDTQKGIHESNYKIKEFINALKQNLGIERRLTRSITTLIAELDGYLQMTDMMTSSVDRIKAKAMVISGKPM